MIQVAFLAAMGVAATVVVSLNQSSAVVYLVVISAGVAVTGAAVRGFGMLATGLAILGVAFGTAVTLPDQEPGLWSGLLVGCALLAAAELGYDWCATLRRTVSRAAYQERVAHLVRTGGLSAVAVFGTVSIAFGLYRRLPPLQMAAVLWLGIPAVLVTLVVMWGVIRTWMSEGK